MLLVFSIFLILNKNNIYKEYFTTFSSLHIEIVSDNVILLYEPKRNQNNYEIAKHLSKYLNYISFPRK